MPRSGAVLMYSQTFPAVPNACRVFTGQSRDTWSRGVIRQGIVDAAVPELFVTRRCIRRRPVGELPRCGRLGGRPRALGPLHSAPRVYARVPKMYGRPASGEAACAAVSAARRVFCHTRPYTLSDS